MIVVDTSVWIGLFRRIESPQVQTLRGLGDQVILVGDVVLLELLRGEDNDQRADRIAREMRAFTGASMLGPRIALDAARNYRALRRLGITVRSTADTIIATYCIDRGYQLLHQDRDFDAFEKHLGLAVLHP